jgi:hypothetical protein
MLIREIKNYIYIAIGVIVISIVTFGITWNFIISNSPNSNKSSIFSNPFDQPVREISLKIDALAEAQISGQITYGDLREMSNIFARDMTLNSTKIKSGEGEIKVRKYYSTAIKYAKSLSNWVDAEISYRVVRKNIDNPYAIQLEVQRKCLHFTDPMNQGLCLMNGATEMGKILEESNELESKLNYAKRERDKDLLELKKSIAGVSTVVTSKSIPKMVFFNQLTVEDK